MQEQIVSVLPLILKSTGPLRARRICPELSKLGFELSRRELNRILHLHNTNPGIIQDGDYKWGYAPSEGLIKSLLQKGACEIQCPSQVPNSFIVYAVINGENILHVGEGQPQRLKSLMRQSNGLTMHQKTLIVAASNVLHGPNHRYFALGVDSKAEGRRIERELHRMFAETFVKGITSIYRPEIANQMLNQLFSLKGIDSTHALHEQLRRAVWDKGQTICSFFWRDETRALAAELFDYYF